jgi:hypothetical protein
MARMAPAGVHVTVSAGEGGLGHMNDIIDSCQRTLPAEPANAVEVGLLPRAPTASLATIDGAKHQSRNASTRNLGG